jgi:hypothetical protein
MRPLQQFLATWPAKNASRWLLRKQSAVPSNLLVGWSTIRSSWNSGQSHHTQMASYPSQYGLELWPTAQLGFDHFSGQIRIGKIQFNGQWHVARQMVLWPLTHTGHVLLNGQQHLLGQAGSKGQQHIGKVFGQMPIDPKRYGSDLYDPIHCRWPSVWWIRSCCCCWTPLKPCVMGQQ